MNRAIGIRQRRVRNRPRGMFGAMKAPGGTFAARVMAGTGSGAAAPRGCCHLPDPCAAGRHERVDAEAAVERTADHRLRPDHRREGPDGQYRQETDPRVPGRLHQGPTPGAGSGRRRRSARLWHRRRSSAARSRHAQGHREPPLPLGRHCPQRPPAPAGPRLRTSVTGEMRPGRACPPSGPPVPAGCRSGCGLRGDRRPHPDRPPRAQDARGCPRSGHRRDTCPVNR